VSVKEEGFVSFLWRPQWLVPNETTSTPHKSEVRSSIIQILSMSTNACTHLSFIFYFLQSSDTQTPIQLRNVSNVECTDLKLYCLLVEVEQKELWLALKSDDELYG
jgi:hypothetical protein